MDMLWRFIGRPKMWRDEYPWRPMDNQEKRAAWAAKYYLQYGGTTHESKTLTK